MRLQPARQQLNPPVLAVVALLSWRSLPVLPSSRQRGGGSYSLVWVRDEGCRPRPIELLSCSPRVQAASMRLQPARQQLNPPVLAVVALLAWRSLPVLPSSRQRGGGTYSLVWVRDVGC